MNILPVTLVTLKCLEVLTLQEGELMLMMDMGNGLKGLLHLTAMDVIVNMTLCLVQNVHTVQWMMSILAMLRQECAILVLVWIMNLAAGVVLNMEMHMVTDLGDQVLDMVAAGAPFLVKILMGCIVAVGRV